ncbi:MAG: hypothetical protein JWR69_863 [Pedosphaera sp.]|nr:hypothetical protein [Pedosphaera sp.]
MAFVAVAFCAAGFLEWLGFPARCLVLAGRLPRALRGRTFSIRFLVLFAGLSLAQVRVSEARFQRPVPEPLTLAASMEPTCTPITSPAAEFLRFHLPFPDEDWPEFTTYFQLTSPATGGGLSLAPFGIACRVHSFPFPRVEDFRDR